ncbi:MAG: Gfo/Idh/MocA family oxidoreductase [Acidobacteria bacterium]|nr:Gfo/Idh/MocA family oxidoreductase [Acidobacteriota bacterium]
MVAGSRRDPGADLAARPATRYLELDMAKPDMTKPDMKKPDRTNPDMANPGISVSSRRRFLGGTGAGAFLIGKPAEVQAQGLKIRAGIVGTGGRGTAAIREFLSGNDDVELVAAADLYRDNLDKALAASSANAAIAAKVKVDPEHRFTGFDAYKKVLASDINLVILTTPPIYRPIHFEAAIAAGKHVFAEKPLAVDPVGARRIMATAVEAEKKKLTVGVGAQRRNQPEYVETIRRIHDGAIGELVAAYAWWQGGPIIRDTTASMGDVEAQTRNWYRYLWLSGDQVVEQHLHNIDVINWVMGGPPVKVTASGGRSWMPLDRRHGNNYDNLTATFEYPTGVISISQCRHFPAGATNRIGELVVGTRGRSNCQDLAPKGPLPPKVQEHVNLVKSIRGQGPYMNLAHDVARSTMTAIMARESAYSGIEITWNMIMASKLDLLPAALESDPKLGIPAPPEPGKYKFI